MKKELSERERRIFSELSPMRAVLALALPTILSQVIGVVYALADTYWVGRSNNPGMVAAIAVTAPLFLSITAISNLFGIGSSSMIARSLGENKFRKARRVSAFGVYGAAAAIMLYALILLVFGRPILLFYGATEDSYDYCRDYVLWSCIIGGLPATMSAVFAHLVRSEGHSREASFGLSMGGILNIVLDPLFMFVLLPDNMEVAGAAMATSLSNLVSTVYFIVYILRCGQNTVLSLNPLDTGLEDRIPLDVVTIGLPSCLMTFLSSFSNAIVNNQISGFSSRAVAGMGIAKKINLMAFRVSTGITQGSLPLIAYNHSARNYDRMRRSILSAGAITVGFACCWALMCFTCGRTLVGLFIADPETVSYGRTFIRIICFAQPLAGTTMTGIIVFQAAAQKKKATLLSVLRKGSLDIPLMFVFNRLWPLYGVACATPVSEVISAAIAVTLVWRFLRSTRSAPAPDRPES